MKHLWKETLQSLSPTSHVDQWNRTDENSTSDGPGWRMLGAWEKTMGQKYCAPLKMKPNETYLVGGFNPFETHYAHFVTKIPRILVKIKDIWVATTQLIKHHPIEKENNLPNLQLWVPD